jgi:hypothetical protein
MSIAFTSRLAWRETIERLSPLCRRVWEAIRDWPGEEGPSIYDLGDKLKMETATISARISDLRDAGAIVDGAIKVGATGKRQKTYKALVWRAPVAQPLQMTLL